uniref:EF-hand domain-containing protein n=1 Tax=Globodera rostochiensis TaxID=31243 RepID=A0A914H888_GLORO
MGTTGSKIGELHLWKGRAPFSPQQLDEYQDCTFFTRKDILRLYKRYHQLDPTLVPTSMHGGQAQTVKLSLELISQMPELRENPFRERICQVFSDDRQGNLSFDDFLDMFSVFSEMAPLQLKLKYAFQIYDFDEDGFLGRDDLRAMIVAITKKEMNHERDELEFIVDRVIEEADLDGDNKISQAEFEHVVSRSPDFIRTFHVRI